MFRAMILAAMVSSTPALAQPAFLEGASIFDINLPRTQSTGGRQLEAFIEGGLMRSVIEFSEGGIYRRLGRPVGRLSVAMSRDGRSGVATCTAFLVADDLILTNHHCIAGAQGGRIDSASFDLGYLTRLDTSGTKRFLVELAPVEADRRLDYAIHRVRGRPGATWGTVTLDPAPTLRPRGEVFMLHHPRGEPQVASLGCELYDPPRQANDILHRCSTLGGSSGSPLFDVETRRVIGLHYSAVERGVNAAKHLRDVVAASPTLQGLSGAQQPTVTAAARMWARIKDAGDPALFTLLEELYPSAPEATLARQRRLAMAVPPPAPVRTRRPAPAVHACDRLAAGPGTHPSVAGVAFQQLDTARAIPACRDAVRDFPDEPRFAYAYGRALRRAGDNIAAVREYRRAADAGYAAGMNNLGLMYDNGKGVAQDDTEAVRWYRRAADAGDAWGMNNLGVMYQEGKGVGQDATEAVRWYRRAANAGNALGMRNLGLMYQNGKGVAQNDTEAVRWYRRAADAGNARGMNNLGFMYREGKGVGQDDTEAVRWYRRAANAGDALGMTNLGFMYWNGRGVAQDDTEAARWFRRAADAGEVTAMRNLALAYELGHGVPQDAAEAARWRAKADAAGQ